MKQTFSSKLSRAEKAVRESGIPDGGLSGVMHELRMEGIAGCSKKYLGLATQFMAPVAVVFACRVLEQARRQGIERLYFLSRDCQLILEAARKLAPQFGDIDCRYLQVSRQALFLPSSTGISEEGMPWLFENSDRHFLDVQLAKLELTLEEVVPFLPPDGGTALDSEEERQAFWAALRQPPLREKIEDLIERRRCAAKKYFEEAGLFDPVKWAVVDLGWLLRCQRALNSLLRGWGHEEEVHGLYLGLLPGREPEERTGPVSAVFETSGAVFEQVVVVENIFCTADHPTVHRYEFDAAGKAVPAYNQTVSATTQERYTALEPVFSAFAGRCADFADHLADPAVAAPLIDTLVESFLQNPVRETIRPLAEMKVSFHQNDLAPFRIIRPLTLSEAVAPAFPEWRCFDRLRKYPWMIWNRGTVAVSPLWIRILYGLSYRLRSLRTRRQWAHGKRKA